LSYNPPSAALFKKGAHHLRILVVEDEEVLAQALVEVLEEEFYAVDLAGDGETASELAAVNDYDLVVLDWTIPPPTGIELLRAWRRSGRDMPVLMLTAHAAVHHRVDGLDTGADDFLVKPFSIPELLARVRSLLRRRAKPLQTRLSADDLEMDRAAHRVTVAGRELELSPKEFTLLEYFLTHKDEAVSRAELAEHVWDDSFDSLANVVDVTIHRLRKKIDGERGGRLLHTLKGVGYVLKSRRG
jgi:two-component system copper resistance phosphate regulon response regulator CusR